MGDSQEDQSQVCLKCGHPITQIPYKYDNQTFHARCLLCSTCGKRLVGKPFVTEGRNIFCGDWCKSAFEDLPTVDLNSSLASEGGNTSTGSVNESLLEALESIKESKQTILKLSRQGSPIRTTDMDRITDYPVCSSPDSALSRSPVPGSRRSSLSAVSESSLTSDGSFTYDASRRPSKKILKKPHGHGPRRRSMNRVRWNLPNGGNESDTTSLESFDSSTTGSNIYKKAQNAMMESRQNWRDFERAPLPGSTGMTPAKVQNQHNLQDPMRPSSPLRSSSPIRPLSPLRASSPPPNIQLSPQRRVPRITVSSNEVPRGYRRSPSPLCNPPRHSSSPPPPPQMSTPLHSHSQMNGMHSTPLRRYTSDTSGMQGRYLTHRAPHIMDQALDHSNTSHNESIGNVINVPILKMNDTSMHELDTSTQEDRRKGHLFKFPHQVRNMHGLHVQRGGKKESTTATHDSPSQKSFSFDDDADDYDHLGPVKEEEYPTGPALDPPPQESDAPRRAHTNKTKLRPPSGTYKDEDIDEALDELTHEEGSPPPAIPPRTLSVTNNTPGWPHHDMHRQAPPSPPPPVPPRTADSLKEPSSPVIQPKSDVVAAARDDHPLPPPPVPPRVYGNQRNRREYHERNLTRGKYKPLPPLPEVPTSPAQGKRKPLQCPLSPTSSLISNTKGSQSPEIEDNLLTPPPEFAANSGRPFGSHDIQESTQNLTPPDDSLGSISDSTLVAGDQGESNAFGLVFETRARSYRPTRNSSSKDQLNAHRRAVYVANNSGSDSDESGAKVSHSAIHTYQPQPVSFNPHSHLTAEGKIQPWAPRVKSPEPAVSSPTSPRHKISLEHAFNEGNLLKNDTYHPPAQPPSNRHRRSLEQHMPEERTAPRVRRTISSPHQPAMSANDIIQHFSPEDQQVLRMFYTGRKLPMMKPVVHDTERSIEKMLAELESEGSGDEKHIRRGPCGICSLCGKTIQSTRTLLTHDSSRYHIKCFHCAVCGCSLRGKKVFRVRNKLLCSDDYSAYGLGSGQPVNMRRPGYQANNYYPSPPQERGIHMPLSSGRITSV